MGKESKDKAKKSSGGARKVVKSLADALDGKKSPGGGGGAKSSKKPAYQKSWAKFAKDGKKKTEGKSLPSSEAVHQETDKKKKKELKQQRASAKPNFELVNNMKSSWNKVRDRSTSEEERVSLINQMMKQIKGNVLQVTLRHDASRMTQCILQYGTEEQRTQVLGELLDKAAEIAKTPYGHFTILKAISYCTGLAHQKKISGSMKGHFVALGTNVVGARIVESLLVIYPSKVSRSLKAEFYGKFTILLAEPPRNLQELLSESTSSKEGPILDHMEGLLQRFVDKGLLEFRYVHDLAWEYCQALVAIIRDTSTSSSGAADAGERRKRASKRLDELTNSLVDFSDKLMVSKPGARTVCHLASHGGAKERKRIIKALKGKTLEALSHEAGHLALMRLIDVTDDTVTIQKSLLEEIKVTKPVVQYTATGHVMPESLVPPLLKVATSPYGKKFLLRLLLGNGREGATDTLAISGGGVKGGFKGRGGHLEPDEAPLFLPSQPASSKKPPATRRKEHLVYFRQPLLAMCTTYTLQLLRSASGAAVLEAVFATYNEPKVSAALCRAFSGQETPAEEDDGEEGQEGTHSDAADSDSGSSSDSESEDDDVKGSEEKGKKGKSEMDSPDEEAMNQDEDEDEDEEEGLGDNGNNKGVTDEGPLEQDRAAFQCLRRLLQRESRCHSSAAEGEEDKTLWAEKGDDAGEVCLLAEPLIVALSGTPSTTTPTTMCLEEWCHSKRGCALLALAAQASDKALAALRAFYGGPNVARLEPAHSLLAEESTGVDAQKEDGGGASRGPQALLDALAVPPAVKGKRKAVSGAKAKAASTTAAGATGPSKKRKKGT